MTAAVRTRDELALMRRAGRVVAEMHERIRAAVRPGVTTLELDAVGREVLDGHGARSNFLGYHGYPAVICASVNDVVVHGIPRADVVLVEGDIVSIDCGAIVEGFHADAAITVPVGAIDAESARLVEVTAAALGAGAAAMQEGRHLSDVGAAIERVVEESGLSVIRDYTGHGIGTAMHEPPPVANVGPPGQGPRLAVGNCLAVEPMVVAGAPDTRVMDDGWTVRTADGARAAHAEHTIAVTPDGPMLLTVA